ncbi:MAG: tetratricopeptide repeat protein [Thermoanaerobaculia bacterium]
MEEVATSRLANRPLLPALLLIALTLAVFQPVLRHDFVNFDDPLYVTGNSLVQRGLTVEGWAWAWTHLYASNWAPLTLLSHMLDVELFGLAPGGHHLIGLLLHALAALALFFALRGATGATWRAFAVAALFAIHPLHVESVAWVAERKDVLSGLLFFATLAAWVGWVRRPSPSRYLVVGRLFALALAAKATVVTLPLVLLLLDHWPLERRRNASPPSWTRLLLEKVPLLGIAIVVGTVTLLAQSEAMPTLGTIGLGRRIATAAVAAATYVVQVFVPRDLAVFYPLPASFSAQWIVGALGLLAVVTLGAWRARKRAPYLLVGWGWYLVTLAPMSGLLQAGSQARADRYTYLPLVGLFLALVWGLADLATRLGRRRLATGLAAAVLAVSLAACALVTRRQLGWWRDSVTLWTRALAVTADNPRAHLNLAEGLRALGRREEALAHYRRALELEAGQADVWAALGNALWSWGRPDEAVPALRRALALDPTDVGALHTLARALAEKGAVDEPIALLEEAVHRAPDLARGHYGLGELYERAGRLDLAIQHYRRALELDPSLDAVYGLLGSVLARHGDAAGALPLLREAVRRSPDSAALRFNLGQVLRQLGRDEEALPHLRRALELDPSLGRPPEPPPGS